MPFSQDYERLPHGSIPRKKAEPAVWGARSRDHLPALWKAVLLGCWGSSSMLAVVCLKANAAGEEKVGWNKPGRRGDPPVLSRSLAHGLRDRRQKRMQDVIVIGPFS